MPQSPSLGFELLTSNQDSKHVTVNASALILEAVSVGVVVDQLNTPPGAATSGQLYIVGTAGTGAFLGQNNKLALYDSTTWYFYSPKTNQTLYNTALASYVRFGGSTWTSVSLGGSSSPTTTKGDLIVRDATTDVRQPVGTNGQVLTADSTVANGLKWATPSTGFADPLTTEGDIIIRDATTTTRLPIGTNGQVLTVDTALNGDLKWATPAVGFASPTTTKGDLIVRDATTDVRQPVGTNGQVLTADSAEATGVKWVSPAASGGVTSFSVLTPTANISSSGTSTPLNFSQITTIGTAAITYAPATGVITFPSVGIYQIFGQIPVLANTVNTRGTLIFELTSGTLGNVVTTTSTPVLCTVASQTFPHSINFLLAVTTANTTGLIRFTNTVGGSTSLTITTASSPYIYITRLS